MVSVLLLAVGDAQDTERNGGERSLHAYAMYLGHIPRHPRSWPPHVQDEFRVDHDDAAWHLHGRHGHAHDGRDTAHGVRDTLDTTALRASMGFAVLGTLAHHVEYAAHLCRVRTKALARN